MRALHALARRYRWVIAWDVFLELSFMLTAGVGTLFLLDRLAFEFGVAELHAKRPLLIVAAFGSALVLAAVAAALSAVARRVNPAGVAWKADRTLGAEERCLTSVELSRDGASAFAPAVLKETAAALGAADPRRIFPSRPIGYRAGVLLALAAGSALAAFPPRAPEAPRAELSVSPTRGVAPLTVVCEDLSQGRVTARTWEFGDGTPARSGARCDHTFERPGTYAIRLSVEGPGGHDRAVSEVVRVYESGAPFADFSGEPLRGRAPLDVRFRNLSRNAERFEWSFGDGAGSAEREPVHRYETPGLYAVSLEVSGRRGADRLARPAYVKVVGSDAPLADFRAYPRRGPAPLRVLFEDNTLGQATEWEWDFGDGLSGTENISRERNTVHEYRRPGRYTVRLRVRGPGGEDEMIRQGYIAVTGDVGGGGGGPDPQAQDQKGTAGAQAGGAGNQPGRLFGEPSERPPANFRPETVRGRPRGEELVEKVKNVYTGDEEAGGAQTEKPYRNVYGDYRRAAEDTLEREQIPPVLRHYVKRYFDQIRPK